MVLATLAVLGTIETRLFHGPHPNDEFREEPLGPLKTIT